MAIPLPVTFVGGLTGPWRVDRITAVSGEGLSGAARLEVLEGGAHTLRGGGDWVLRGVTSNTRYTTRPEADALGAVQQGLRRPGATRAALIPIRKAEAWWDMTQDERGTIFGERSRHVAIGLAALPGVARRLHNSRELGEPFDFLTWFEYAPEHQGAFDDMLGALRGTAEWGYVEREVDVRLTRDAT